MSANDTVTLLPPSMRQKSVSASSDRRHAVI
jgi:hypothetical protein